MQKALFTSVCGYCCSEWDQLRQSRKCWMQKKVHYTWFRIMVRDWILLAPKVLIWDKARSLLLSKKQIIWLIVILVVISLDLAIPSLFVLHGFANQSGLGLHQTEFGFNLNFWHPSKKPEQLYHFSTFMQLFWERLLEKSAKVHTTTSYGTYCR